MERSNETGKIYRHFKGKEYKIVCIALDSESSDEHPNKLVIYEALYGDHLIWARPYDMFNSKVDKIKYPDVSQEYRFEEVI